MVALAEYKGAYKYVNDDGTEYAMLGKISIHSQGVTGAAAAEGDEELPPKGFKPRVARVSNGTLVREVVCFTTSATLWTTPATAINLDVNDVSTAFTGKGPKARRREFMPRTFVPQKAIA